MTVNEDSKLIGIWLTRAEVNDAALRESLKPLYKKYHDQKYKVAVYMSGEQEMYENARPCIKSLFSQKLAEKQKQAREIVI